MAYGILKITTNNTGRGQCNDGKAPKAVGVVDELLKESAKKNLMAEKSFVTEREINIFAI